MAIDWGNYEPFDPKLYRPYHEASPSEAAAAFEHLMAEKDRRIAQLNALLERNGVALDTSSSVAYGRSVLRGAARGRT